MDVGTIDLVIQKYQLPSVFHNDTCFFDFIIFVEKEIKMKVFSISLVVKDIYNCLWRDEDVIEERRVEN